MTPTANDKPLYALQTARDVEGFDALAELALDMRSSWLHDADHIWHQLDEALWALTHNPWVVLQTVSREKLQQVFANPVFRKNVDDLVQAQRDEAKAPAWFQQTYPQSSLTLRRVFQHGVHAERGATYLFGRAWQCGGRSAQGRQRSGRTGHRCGVALPARLFSPGDRQGRRPAGTIPL